MYERTLQSAVRYLATIPRHTVPMQDLWTAVIREARASRIEECTLPDFAALLEADTRFAILENGFDPDEIDLDGIDEDRRELFELGFSPSCLVTLRRSADGEEAEEMPSIVHKHLSETRRVRALGKSSSAGNSTRRTRQKRGVATVARRKKNSIRRRRT